MRLCVPIPCFFKGNFVESIKTVSELGFDAIETYEWGYLDADAVKGACKDNGVELISILTTEFRMTSPECRDLWLQGIKDTCEAAVKLGASRVITQVGNDTGAPRQAQHDSIVAALKAAKPILDATGIILMIEPLNTLVDHKGYYLWSAYEAFDIIREVDDSHVKVVYDIYHQQVMEGNIIPNVINNLDCIAHLHSAGHPGRHELQFGENDYKVIFDAIDKAGYTGACGLEYTPKLNNIESLKEVKRIYGK